MHLNLICYQNLQLAIVGRSMTIPNTFDIQYMYQNAENNYLNKISTCVLEYECYIWW